MSLNTFFCYFGSKGRAAAYYPPPLHDTIIEPFAGSAGYAVRHHRKRVILVDKDPDVVALWRYLIKVSARDVLRLPDLPLDGKVSDLVVSDEARLLIGYNVQYAAARGPRDRFSSWSRGAADMWGPTLRARLAAQVEKIRHWKVIEGSYELAPDVVATWHIDPPYEVMGKHYRCSATDIDFAALGRWCRERQGQVMVCENDGAKWLPFRTLRAIQAANTRGVSLEVIWTND